MPRHRCLAGRASGDVGIAAIVMQPSSTALISCQPRSGQPLAGILAGRNWCYRRKTITPDFPCEIIIQRAPCRKTSEIACTRKRAEIKHPYG